MPNNSPNKALSYMLTDLVASHYDVKPSKAYMSIIMCLPVQLSTGI